MNSSQSPPEAAALAKPPPYCAFSGCTVPPTNTCSRCLETKYCSKAQNTAHWTWHKRICIAPEKKLALVPPQAPSLKRKAPHASASKTPPLLLAAANERNKR